MTHPSKVVRCARCGAHWTGSAVAHCGGCHRTFSTASLFDRHRRLTGEHGECLDPASVVNGRTGEQLLVFRDGMWRGPEMTDEQKRQRFGEDQVA